MSDREVEGRREAGEAKAAVRLRVPERRQMAMVVQCPDDLVPAQHPVRMSEAKDLCIGFFRVEGRKNP
ncbi:MAG: hypothetical protein HYR57_02105 [Candidatus Koribacter versatilis]|nr:hypothetical protein [Candidatus Koribacter versatilis]